MTTEHRFLRKADPQTSKVLAAGPIDAGDIVKWDTSNLYAVRQATGAAVQCMGVSMDTIPVPSNIDSSDIVVEINVVGGNQGDVFSFKTTASETLKHGLWVEVGADSQTVKLTSTAANRVGRIELPDGRTITGAAGTEVPVKLLPQYSGNVL